MAEKPDATRPPARQGAPSRRRAAIAAAALFPLLVSAGVMAPGLVELALQTGGPSAGPALSGGVPSPFEHQPLPAPRDPAVALTPVALELDRVFFETDYQGADPALDYDGARLGGAGAGPTAAEIAQLLSFPRHDTDPIVLDLLAAPEDQIVFKDALIPEPGPEVQLPDQSAMFLPLCPSTPSTNCVRFDDFTTVRAPSVIPEPATAPLVAAGLALLAVARRRRR
jgi:hypothetical protein